MLLCMALVRTDVSEEHIASIIRMTRIGELGTMLAVTIFSLHALVANYCCCSQFTDSCHPDDGEDPFL
jgi:hypothetical protein